MMGYDHWIWAVIATIGVGFLTIVTRSFFLIPNKELPLPNWIKRGLKYAPLAALSAVVMPEIFLKDGQLITSLADARFPASIVAGIYFLWKRSILGTILVGMIIYIPLHLFLGW